MSLRTIVLFPMTRQQCLKCYLLGQFDDRPPLLRVILHGRLVHDGAVGANLVLDQHGKVCSNIET